MLAGQVPAWKPLSNSITHMKNGNRRGAGKVMKIATWNAGSAYLGNKMNELESVVQSLSPHILVISECNLKLSHDRSNVQIPDYELHVSKTINNVSVGCMSRVAIYQHNSIVSKLREDLMEKSLNSVWLSRWSVFLSQWESALAEGKETIVLCDINLDWLTVIKQNPPWDSRLHLLQNSSNG